VRNVELQKDSFINAKIATQWYRNFFEWLQVLAGMGYYGAFEHDIVNIPALSNASTLPHIHSRLEKGSWTHAWLHV